VLYFIWSPFHRHRIVSFIGTRKSSNIPRDISLGVLTKCKCEMEEISCLHTYKKCKFLWPVM
jgi:hypothetical protein